VKIVADGVKVAEGLGNPVEDRHGLRSLQKDHDYMESYKEISKTTQKLPQMTIS
jgi:hypothetical protein